MNAHESTPLFSRGTPWTLRVFWCCAVVLLCTGLLNEFHAGHEGWCGARRGVAARNAVDQGFLETNMGMVLNTGEFDAEDYKPYWHHPAGIHWLVTASFGLLGEGTVQARIVPTLLMGLNLVLFILLGRHWFPKVPSWVVGSLFLSIPMLGFYGPFIAHQPLMLSFALLTLILQQRYLKEQNPQLLWAMGGSALLGGFTAWAWFLFAFATGCACLAHPQFQEAHRKKWLLVFSAGTLTGFALVLLHTWIQSGVQWETLDSLFSKRAGGVKMTSAALVKKMAGPWLELFNPYAVLLGLFYLGRLVWRRAQRKSMPEAAAALSFLFTGLTWTWIFKQGASVHEYWPWYTAPFFALAALDFMGLLFQTSSRWNSLKRMGTIGLTFTLIVGTGVLSTYGRHHHPSPSHPEWSESYFLDRIDAWKWMRAHTERPHRLALHSGLLPSAGRAQYRFYANRSHRKLSLKQALSKTPIKKGDALIGIHLGTLPPKDSRQVARHWVATLDTTLMGHVLIAQRPEGETPRTIVLHSRESSSGMISAWLSPTSPPMTWEESPILTRSFLLNLGFKERALSGIEPLLKSSIEEVQSLEEKIARHNLEVTLTPANPPATDWVDGVLPGWDREELAFGKEVTLLGKKVTYRWRYGVDVQAILKVKAVPSQPWAPTLKSVREYEHRERKESKSHPFPYWGNAGEWLPGQLIYLHRYSALPNRRSLLGVEYRFALWSGGKGNKKYPYLRPGNGKSGHYVTWEPEPGERIGWLDWIGLGWMRGGRS